MTDIGKLVQSAMTIRLYDVVDPYNTVSYPGAGVYYNPTNQTYYLVGNTVYGISKSAFEAVFVEVDPKPISVDIDGIKEEIFLKTVALLSGRASEFKDL